MNSEPDTEAHSNACGLPKNSRNRSPRSWFVSRHRCHFVKQRLCLATQTPTESAWLRGRRPQSRRADLSALQRLLKSGTVGTVLPNGGRIHHYVSCNDSLGRRHVELNETFLGNGHDEPGKLCCDRLDAHLVAPKFSTICSGGGGTAALIAVRSKICCDCPKARLVTPKFSKIVLGGTAASHTCSGVGGGNFFDQEVFFVVCAVSVTPKRTWCPPLTSFSGIKSSK